MKAEIDIRDYISEEEMHAVALSVLRGRFAEQLRSETDIERVLSNLTSEYVFGEVCKSVRMNRQEIQSQIDKGIQKALESDHIKFLVFRRSDAWDRSESPVVKMLDETLKNCRQIIEQEVEKRIKQYDFRELEAEIEDVIYNTICRKLREPPKEDDGE